MGISSFLIAFFPMGLSPSYVLKNYIHIYAAAVQFVLFPVTSFLLGLINMKVKRILIFGLTFISTGTLVFLFHLLRIENQFFQQCYGFIQRLYIMLIVLYLAGISVVVILKSKKI
ncbi:MAG: DUF998 domain-containing protein [Bacteroidales bacterium]|nr:DUF998 domain-containing protein [Bacteroidales bacterium]